MMDPFIVSHFGGFDLFGLFLVAVFEYFAVCNISNELRSTEFLIASIGLRV